jgi:superfamily I DNA and/or RNA helicase
MFAALPSNSLGHTVIEEAGQATPQSILGLAWRSKRILVIGDQRQLEPIVITSPALERQLATELTADVRNTFSPLCSSAQSLADRAEQYGTWFSDGGEKKTWVGLPLLMHRRCASPMFEIANRVAYDNLMLQGLSGIADPHPVFGSSCWFDVKGAVSGRHWVPNQGVLLADLFTQLLQANLELSDIFWISPFREIKERLKSLIRRECRKHDLSRKDVADLLRRIGTVHTFQGKEADVVFLVLGCDFSACGAADWAGEKPNLLNVAVTRARKQLYVIGDVDLWHNRGYFSDLEKALEKRRG